MSNKAFSCIMLLFFSLHSFITCAHLLTPYTNLKKCISHIDQRQTNKNLNLIKYPPKATIKGFQRFYHCSVTRLRNPDIVEKIYKHDHGKDSIYESSSYTFYPGSPRWPGRRIKYGFSRNVKENMKQPLEHALQQWASVSSLKFYRVKQICQADIWISFLRGYHGDEFPFDGANGHVAHAFGLPDGRVHFDAAQNRSINKRDKDGVHWTWKPLGFMSWVMPSGLGIAKSNRLSCMYPIILRGESKGLHEADIRGI